MVLGLKSFKTPENNNVSDVEVKSLSEKLNHYICLFLSYGLSHSSQQSLWAVRIGLWTHLYQRYKCYVWHNVQRGLFLWWRLCKECRTLCAWGAVWLLIQWTVFPGRFLASFYTALQRYLPLLTFSLSFLLLLSNIYPQICYFIIYCMYVCVFCHLILTYS